MQIVSKCEVFKSSIMTYSENGILFRNKRSKLLSYKEEWKKLECTWLSKRCQSEGYIPYDSNYMTFWKNSNYSYAGRIRTYQGFEGWWMNREKHRIFWVMNCALWYYNYGSKSLYICPNQYNVPHQEWTLRKMVIMICLCRFTSYNNVSLWWQIYIKCCTFVGQSVYGKFLYLPMNFAVNLKLL